MTSVDRTPYPRFPRSCRGGSWRRRSRRLTVRWIGAPGRTQNASHLLALVVWLKSCQQLGYFPKLAEVTGHVRGYDEATSAAPAPVKG